MNKWQEDAEDVALLPWSVQDRVEVAAQAYLGRQNDAFTLELSRLAQHWAKVLTHQQQILARHQEALVVSQKHGYADQQILRTQIEDAKAHIAWLTRTCAEAEQLLERWGAHSARRNVF